MVPLSFLNYAPWSTASGIFNFFVPGRSFDNRPDGDCSRTLIITPLDCTHIIKNIGGVLREW